MNNIDECFSQIRDAEIECLNESYKSFIDEMSEKGVDLENILSFDEYKKFHNFLPGAKQRQLKGHKVHIAKVYGKRL